MYYLIGQYFEFQKSMNITEMWKTFSQRRKTFLSTYIAYHYYRSCGWIPKPGLKFGTDLSKFARFLLKDLIKCKCQK